jgi:hypothetical protein
MGCTYHQEYNAAKLAIMTAAPIFGNFTANPINFVMIQFNNGAGNMVTLLNRLNGMYQAVNTFLNSTNLPHGIDMEDHQAVNKYITPIRMRRASPIWNDRRALLLALIQMLRAIGAGFWPGQGGVWF